MKLLVSLEIRFCWHINIKEDWEIHNNDLKNPSAAEILYEVNHK